MGIIQVPNLESYWNTSWSCNIPLFGSLMPRDRFFEIFWLLYVSHEDLSRPAKKIDKVLNFLDMLLERFRKYHYPNQNISVDETMVGFQGQFGSTQYMPKKPVKWGIKAFTMADGDAGYMLGILVYTGAETLDGADPMYASLPVPAKVVLHLAAPYLDKGHHFFADRYYSSIPLVQALEDRSSAFTGTVMRNRVGLPHLIRTESSSLRAGESMEYCCGRLLAVSWRDKSAKQPVTILTSSCSAAKVTVATRRGESQIKPLSIDTYNQSMNGVDRLDQFTVYYSFVRKTRKWWRKLFYLLEVLTVNAYILYRSTVESPLSHLEFRRSVLEDLAMGYI